MNQEPLRKYLKFDTNENPVLCVDEDTPVASLAADLAEAFDTEYEIAEDIARSWLEASELDATSLAEMAIEIEVATLLHRMAKSGEIDYRVGDDGEFLFSVPVQEK